MALVTDELYGPQDIARRVADVGRNVIRSGVVETWLQNQLREEKPRSIRFACVVDHPQDRKSALRGPSRPCPMNRIPRTGA